MTLLRTALAPPRKVVTREERIGSAARSRGTWRRWVTPVSGSAIRKLMMPSSGSASNACRRQLRGVGERQQSVVVEEEQSVHIGAGRAECVDPDVATARDAEVLGQLDGAYTRGDVRYRGAVADDHHFDPVAVLLGDRIEEGAQFLGTVAHRDDDRAELHGGTHFSLLDARIDTRCRRVWTMAM